MLSILAKILLLPFEILYYFKPELRKRFAPKPHELMDVDNSPNMHPKIQDACKTLALGLISGPVSNHVTFHLLHDEGRDVVVDVYFIDGLSPSQKIARLEALLEETGVENPFHFSKTRLDKPNMR